MREIRSLGPAQIITLNDYPLYDLAAFFTYERMIRSDERIPYVPVIPTDLIRFEGALAARFEAFTRSHPNARFFMVDGSHRTTALSRMHRPIEVVIYRSDADIESARAAVAQGLVNENGSLECTFDENVALIIEHFERTGRFMTVEEKTQQLMHEGFIASFSV